MQAVVPSFTFLRSCLVIKEAAAPYNALCTEMYCILYVQKQKAVERIWSKVKAIDHWVSGLV